MNNKIYATGGYSGSTFFAANEEYDPATNTWSTKAAMPGHRYAHAAAAVNNKVYAIGGDGYGVGWVSLNEEYDPTTNTWSTKAAMPTAREWLAAGTVNNKIYAIGGNASSPGAGVMAVNEEFALISLVNDAIEHEIATVNGVTITRKELDTFKRHVDEQTKAPEILQKVKLLFGNDWSSYERIYLAPKIMNWKLHDFHSRSPDIHKKERSLIEKAYDLVAAGEGFREAAEECGLTFSSSNAQNKGTTLPTELSRYTAQNNTSVNDPLIPILDTLRAGEIYRNIVEDDSGYRIIRLIERTGETYSVEAITVNKRPFDEWFKEEAAKVGIEIVDPDLKDIIKTKYPGLWWVRNVTKE